MYVVMYVCMSAFMYVCQYQTPVLLNQSSTTVHAPPLPQNIFVFCIIGRDLALADKEPTMWAAFSFAGLLLPLLLANSTLSTRRALIDHCHYLAMIIWFGATLMGEMGHVWFAKTYMNWDFAAK